MANADRAINSSFPETATTRWWIDPTTGAFVHAVHIDSGDADNPLPVGIRQTAVRTVTIANGAAVSGAFDMSGYAIAYVEVPGTWTAANIGIVIAEAVAGTYQTASARDRYGTRDVISGVQTSELCAYEAPAGWAGAHFAKLTSLNTGTGAAENQGGDRTLRVFLKS